MKLISRCKQTKFAALLKKTFFYEICKKDWIRRSRAVRLSGKKSLAKGLVMDKVDVVITTKYCFWCAYISDLGFCQCIGKARRPIC